MSRRAELLADRIEEGAAGLAAFAEALSEAEWSTPVSGTDRRPVGVIVHHVAIVYPIEADLARKIASGKAVTNVTWDVVAELNAKLNSRLGAQLWCRNARFDKRFRRSRQLRHHRARTWRATFRGNCSPEFSKKNRKLPSTKARPI